MRIIIGIDPGLKGGVTVLKDGVIQEMIPMPVYQIHTGKMKKRTRTIKGEKTKVNTEKILNRVNSRALAEIIVRHPDAFIFMEDVHTLFGMSAASNFSMGHGLGVLDGLIGALKLDHFYMVEPKIWQKEVWIKDDHVTKLVSAKRKGIDMMIEKIDPKPTTLAAARRIFPNETFLKSKRSKVPADGLYDSSMLAEYGDRWIISEQSK